MLTPDELRELPEDVVDIFKDCEDEILRKIGEKIAETGDLSKANVRKLKSLKNRTLMQEDLSKTLQKYSGKSKKELRKLFKEAGELSLLDDDKTVGEKHRSKKMNDLLRAISAQTEGTMQNMTRTTARNATNDFYKELDKAVLSVQSGSSTQEQAIKRCIDNLADKMDYVEYNGRRDTLEVAVRRAVRTGLNQLTAELTLLRCEEQGIEFVEVSAHAGARTSKAQDCNNHAWWQGKVYHIGKDWGYARKRAYPPLMAYHFAGYGYGEGLCGWNCRHSFRPYIPYVTGRRYTERDLQRLNKKSVTYNGKKYTQEEIDQVQRYYERQIRKYKRRAILAESSENKSEYSRAMVKVREWQDVLKDLTKQTDGHRELGREYVPIYPGVMIDSGNVYESADLELFPISPKNSIYDKITIQGSLTDEERELLSGIGYSFYDTPQTIKSVFSSVNKHKGKTNCQSVVITAEANFRGVKGIAIPQSEGDYDLKYLFPQNGGHSFSEALEGFKPLDISSRSQARVRERADALMKKWGDESRAIIGVDWVDSGSHVFTVIRHNGQTYYLDFQGDRLEDVSYYFDMIDETNVFIARIDDKKLTKYIQLVMEKTE